MTAAAIAKATGARPIVVGKPSRAALRAITDRLGAPPESLAVIGDDLGMDIALGRLGGSRTILVRSGISSLVTLEHVAEKRRPDAVVDGVAELLDWL
jgi:NagD protein